MRSITVYHGSSRPDVVPNHEKILYVTPDTRYNYIQHSEYTYRASFKSQTPYLTDNQSFVEALRSNPRESKFCVTWDMTPSCIQVQTIYLPERAGGVTTWPSMSS